MKILLNTFFLLLTFLVTEKNIFALTDYQMRKLCKNKSNEETCIKNLKYKKLDLLKGNRIEIPVIPFKK